LNPGPPALDASTLPIGFEFADLIIINSSKYRLDQDTIRLNDLTPKVLYFY